MFSTFRSVGYWLLAGMLSCHVALADGLTTGPGAEAAANVRVMFTPGQDVAGAIIDAVRGASKQVLVQAFSFTHPGIAQALVDAHRRGVTVKVVADRQQAEQMEYDQLPLLVRGGVPVWLDGAHASAHNKIMIIDAETIITGSFNFTRAAQQKNAENTLFISGNESIVQAYLRNWTQHLEHSRSLSLN